MEQTAFLHILASLATLITLLWVGARISAWLRPHRTSATKRTTYESGSEPVGSAKGPINSRLYIIGLIFLLFEVETLLLFPWALVWMNKDMTHQSDTSWSLQMAILGTSFILLLALGWLYFLIKCKNAGIGNMPTTLQYTTHSGAYIPSIYYEQINAKYATQPKQRMQQPTNEDKYVK